MSETSSVIPMGIEPLKRVELHVNKFPHRVDLLRKHKSNIEKFQACGDWEKVNREQINATRLVKQLTVIMYDMEMLRGQVQDSDLEEFNKLTADASTTALDVAKEYLAMTPEKLYPVWVPPKSPDTVEDKLGAASCEDGNKEVLESQVKLVLNLDDGQKQEAYRESWKSLREGIEDFHDLLQEFEQLVHDKDTRKSKHGDGARERAGRC